MTDRLAWSPDGRRVLVLRGGALTIRTPAGETVTELATRVVRVRDTGYTQPRYLTARWLADGRIVAVDSVGRAVVFSMRGKPYGDLDIAEMGWTPALTSDSVDLSGDGRVYFTSDASQVNARATGAGNEHLWMAQRRELHASGPFTRALASWDATRLALCTPTTPMEWIVCEMVRGSGGRRFSVASRILAPDVAFAGELPLPIPLPVRGAVVDERGVRIAHADATALHVTYRDANETIALPHGIAAPITALAFGPDEVIACLTADGAVELLPIP